VTKWYERAEDSLWSDYEDGMITENQLYHLLEELKREVAEARMEAMEAARNLASENF